MTYRAEQEAIEYLYNLGFDDAGIYKALGFTSGNKVSGWRGKYDLPPHVVPHYVNDEKLTKIDKEKQKQKKRKMVEIEMQKLGKEFRKIY